MVIGEAEEIKRKYEMPNFFQFKNQQSSLDNYQSKSTASGFSTLDSLPSTLWKGGQAHFRYRELSRFKARGWGCAAIRWLTHTGRDVSPSGLKPGAGFRL
jgi:hypothetical protein